MSDPNIEAGDIVPPVGLPDVIGMAIDAAAAANEPTLIGDAGKAYVIPEGWKVQVVDDRQYEDDTRLPLRRIGSEKFVGVVSLAQFVNRYKTDATLAYITDVYGRGQGMLTRDTDVAKVILDDHPVGARALHSVEWTEQVGRRQHTATLVLRPTAAARRWGHAFASPIDQEQFLDLVVDGIGEIAKPDGAVLRDLVQDLHAIRSTAIKSVVRTGGQGAIEVSDNVKLHAGTGNEVPFPESMTLVFQPFAGISSMISVEVRIKPKVGNERVTFSLSCPTLDDQLARVLGDVAAHIAEAIELVPHWVP